MPLPGMRHNPVFVTTVHDLDRATRHVARPSTGQASAGNYRKAHVNVGGLNVTIETPKETMRRGVGRDGTPWAVMVLADYGYVKQTTGADGDQVDVYLGPFSHQAEAVPVWIVDQCDADTKEWDEHKCLLGFSDSESARTVYLGGFSDGRGHERIGGVMRMSFATFKNWLKSGHTKKPLTYRSEAKSASSDVNFVPYGASILPCAFGGQMTVVPEQDKPAASDPRTLGSWTSMLAKAFGRMTPAERTELMQDAAVTTATELGKADNFMTVDPAHTGYIEDHWSTTKETDAVRVSEAHGPGSSVPSGVTNVGPSQAASGNGAERMEPQYSRYTGGQSGFQNMTEKLGRDIMGIRGAMKSMMSAMTSLGTQIEMLKANTVTGASAPEADVLQKMVETAVAKAMVPVKLDVSKALAKADKEKDDDKEDDEEAKAAAIVAKADEKEKEKERDEEGTAKSETADAAAELRLMAKARIAHAKLRISKALDFVAEEKAKAAQRAMSFAEINLAKAQSHLDESVALIGGTAGLSTQTLALEITKAKKGIAASTAKNQDIWPSSTDKQADFGKAADPVTPPAEATKAVQPANADLAKAIQQIEAAANGMGMMTASVGDLFKALANQTKPPAATTGGGEGERPNMPPVFALAKAGASDLATREAELTRLRDQNTISFEDHDRARDALTRVRMGLPEETIKAMVDRLPDAARAVLTRAAA